MEKRVLMINVIGKPVPFAFQVSEPTYQRFKFIEGGPDKPWKYLENVVFPEIEKFELELQANFFQQIEDWKIRTQEELKTLDLHEQAQTRAKGIFDQ